MKLIIGLGNPGKRYEKTRHNAGFMAIDELRARYAFAEFSLHKKFDAEMSEGIWQDEKIILAKPQAFMNRSGQVVRAIMDFYKLSANDIVVIHDDLDIDLGTFKISIDSSAGGHNGVQSIVDTLGTQQFKRLRIGIEGTERKKSRTMPGEAFVLQSFSKEEVMGLGQILDNIVGIIDKAINY